jgi:aromatic ring-cleaving dioxygenase
MAHGTMSPMQDSTSQQNADAAPDRAATLPSGTRAIGSYHAHVYFRSPEEREQALALRGWLSERFLVQLGRVHDLPVGPHSAPMYQVAFAKDRFEALVPWLMLNRRGLSVLVHPNTGRARDDHLRHAIWLGDELAIHGDVLSNAASDGDTSALETNTLPHLASE